MILFAVCVIQEVLRVTLSKNNSCCTHFNSSWFLYKHFLNEFTFSISLIAPNMSDKLLKRKYKWTKFESTENQVRCHKSLMFEQQTLFVTMDKNIEGWMCWHRKNQWEFQRQGNLSLHPHQVSYSLHFCLSLSISFWENNDVIMVMSYDEDKKWYYNSLRFLPIYLN